MIRSTLSSPKGYRRRDLIWGTILAFAWNKETCYQPQSGQYIYRPSIECTTT